MTVMAAAFTTGAFSQSNQQGTIQVGLGWGVTLGGATLKTTPEGGSEIKGTGEGAKANFGLRAQYGLSENLSAGIYVRSETAVYVVTLDDYTSAVALPDITYSGTAFGLEGKYYLANSDGFNFYPAISVGYTTGNNEISDITFGTSKTDLSGFNYSIGIGLNWYFISDVFGLSTDIGYQGTMLSGTQDADAYGNPKRDVEVTNSGLVWGLGLTAHFGGK